MATDDRQITDDPDLKEIREEYADADSQWEDIRKEARTDMRFIGGDPWEEADRKARDAAMRPILSPDETNQYVHQVVNDVRQNKRAIKVTPMGAGANDQTADVRANLIRQIEYRSNAQQAYTTLFENAVQRSYGYLRICPDYTDHRSFDQELRILPCENPDMVTPDPYAVRTDGSDWKFLYFSEVWRVSDYKRKWPRAKTQSFGNTEMTVAAQWVKSESQIVVAERWTVQTSKRVLLLIQVPNQPAPMVAFADELEALPPGAKVVREREVDYPSVTKQITNGLEILEETKFKSTTIPFVSCYGKILYLDSGSGPEKRIMSLVRLARDPAKLHAYIWTCIAEVVGGVPRNAWIGYEGQFAKPAEWQRANREPVAYLEAKARTEETGGMELLPLPQRQPWDPPIQNLLIAAEAARRQIQAAMGIAFLPTDAQKRNEKSGKALDKIEDSQQRGSFHFVDHYDEAITRTGAILDDWMPHHYDAARDLTVRKPDDKTEVIRANDPNDPKSVNLKTGQHDVTISVGPAFQSEREAASTFADTIIASPIIELLGPEKGQKIVALAIRLKSVGPLGDQMADIISPDDDKQQGPTPEQVQQMQAMIQQLQQKLAEAVQEIQTDAAKQRAVIEKANIDAKADIAKARMAEATKLRIAQLSNVVKPAQEQSAEAIQAELQREFDLILEEVEHQHKMELERVKAQHAAEADRRALASGLVQGEQGHKHTLESGEQQVAGKLAVEASKPKPAPKGQK